MEAFDELVARSDQSMIVVTAATGDRHHGCLVGFHSQVSIEPRRYLVALSHDNATFRAAEDASHLGVHLLGATDGDLASLFGSETADEGADKFTRCSWRQVDDGPPVLAGVAAWFIGTVVARHRLGDHTGFVLEPALAGVGSSALPLRYGQVRPLDAGH